MKIALPTVPVWLSAVLVIYQPIAHSVEFESENGDIAGSLDTTLSLGAMWRVQGQDLTRYNGEPEPNHDDVNTNDGNRSFEKGLVSQVYKVTSELELNYKDTYGLFIRGSAFYDSVLMAKSSHWNSANQAAINNGYSNQAGTYPFGNNWSSDVKGGQGKDLEIKDAYLFAETELGDMPVDLRFGKHVMNWGEGLFYRDGINTSNAMDLANFVLPGAEVKDLLIPENAFSLNLGISDNLSMSAYYQFGWQSSELPGRGTYFSNNDIFADGSTAGYNQISAGLAGLAAMYSLGNGVDYYSDLGIVTDGDYLKVADTSGKVDADKNGQWGFNFKYFAEELNDTEFGFYFVNYNSHSPFIEAEVDKVGALTGAAAISAKTTEFANALTTSSSLLFNQLTASGACNDLNSCTEYLIGQSAGAYTLSNSVSAYQVFPEDIQMYGISFNTAVGEMSIGGELAFRPEMPIWIDHPNDLIDGIKDNMSGILDPATTCFTNLSQAEPNQQYCLADGAYKNYKTVQLWTGSFTFLRNFGPIFGFDGLYGIFSPGFEYVDGLDTYYNYVSTASSAYGDSFSSLYRPESDRLDSFSWGITAVLSGELNDVFWGVNLNPLIKYKQDVSGNSRLGGNYLEGRKAITLALNGIYLNQFEAGVSYTSFFGAKRTNKLHDRDNIALTAKYSF